MNCYGLAFAALCIGVSPQEPPKTVTITVCPQERSWSAADQKQVSEELRTIQQGSATQRAIRDYINLRDQVRACKSQKK